MSIGPLEIIILAVITTVIVVVLAVAIFAFNQRAHVPPRTFETEHPPLDSAAMQTITDLLRSGQKIEAIKLFRERTGAGLSNAKQVIDGMERNLGSPATPGSGGFSMPATPELDSTTRAEIEEQLLKRNLIEAINYRQATGVGLKDAKDALEAMHRNM